MEDIASRERLRSAREKLAHIFVEKFSVKYGKQHKSLILEQVRRFITERDGITPDDIATLDNILIDSIKSKRRNQEIRRNNLVNDVENNETSDNFKRVASSNEVNISLPADSEWVILHSYQAIEDEKRTKEELENALLKKKKFRKMLDDQLQQARKMKALNRYDDKDYAEYIAKDVEIFHEEEKRKKEIVHRKHSEELHKRKAQIDEANKRKNEEKESLRLFEEQNLVMAQIEIEKENEKFRHMKQVQKDNLARIEKENEENQRIIAITKKLEADEDNKLMQAYAAKLDKEAFDRENAFKQRMAGMAAFAQKYESEGAGKKLREQEIAIERLLLKEQKKKEDDDAAKEKKKIEDAANRAHFALLENEKLKQRKIEVQEMERQKDAEFARLYNQEALKFKDDMLKFKQLTKEKQEHYRSVLKSQMSARESAHKVSKNGMEDRERELNSIMLKKIIDDKEVFSKVLHRVRIAEGREKRVNTAPQPTRPNVK